MLNQQILIAFSFFSLCAAFKMVNPFDQVFYSAWGRLRKNVKDARLDERRTCSSNSRNLIEAQTFLSQDSNNLLMYENGRGVLRITAKRFNAAGEPIGFEYGTGFLVGNEGYFMTALHVLPIRRDYRSIEVAIEVMAECPPGKTSRAAPFECSGYFNKNGIKFIVSGRNSAEDWAIYKLQGEDTTKFLELGGGGATLALRVQPAQAQIYSFHHIAGVAKKANVQAGTEPARIVDSSDFYLSWMDISSGGSGAPLFRKENHQVVAVHMGSDACDMKKGTGPRSVRSADIALWMEDDEVIRPPGITADFVTELVEKLFAL